MKKLNSHEILGISLLSVEEYRAAGNNIPPLDEWWWLRSPGFDSYRVTCVDPYGDIHGYPHVRIRIVGVRPVLYVNMESTLPIGEKALFGDRIWTHIAKNMFLCNEVIVWMTFRKDWQADDANDYEKSDVKAFLDDWLNKILSKHGKSPELSQEEKLRIYYEQAHSLHMQDAKKRAIDYIEAAGCNPAFWLNKFNIDLLATMFEEKRSCDVTDNDTWLTVFQQYINEHEV